MTEATPSAHAGSCHCGAVAFEFDGEVKGAMSCNCSWCRRRGSLLHFVPAESFRQTAGGTAQTSYLFNKKQIEHLFCSTCGVESFGRDRLPSGEAMVAVNLRCVPAIDLDALHIKKVDGASL